MAAPIRIGILGCARIAKAALIDPARLMPDLDVVAVASRGRERSSAFAQEHGIPVAYGDYQALLADPEIDAIYNPLPNSLHAEWSIRALEAGKAVLCEKPFAANAQEASRMADAARAAGLPLMEAFHYRHHPLARHIAAVVRAGHLGRILKVDTGLQITPALVPPDDIRFRADLAGGAMMDVGAYCLNVLRLVTGEEPHVESASATLVSAGVDGAMSASLQFPSGATGRVDCSLIASELKAWLRIEGENGWLQVNNPFLPHVGHSFAMEVDGIRSERSFEDTPTYVFQAQAFAAVMRGEPNSLTSAEDGVANMEAIDATYRAAGLTPRG
jgi:predicted dehydrogenase